MYLDNIEIENFKSLLNVKINPKKITILIGPNSSGKSSILQLLTIIKQSLGSASQGYFHSDRHIINLGNFSDIVYDHDVSKKIRINTDSEIRLTEKFEKIFGRGPAHFSYDFSVSKEGIDSVYCRLTQKSFDASIEVLNGSLMAGRFVISKGEGTFQLTNNRGLLPGVSVHIAPGNTDVESQEINKIFNNGKIIEDLFKNYYYIPPSRIIDEYGLPLVGVRDDEIIDAEGHRTNLSRLLSYLSSSPPQVINMISEWTEKLFGKKIKTRNVPTYKNQQETTNATIDFLEDQHYNAIVNEGTGTNQVILLLTMLGITPHGSVLGIEEPEIHLHPKAQADLANILIDVSLRHNKQIIFTTHSEHMLYPFLTSIARKDDDALKPKDLSILYFEKDKETYRTVVTPLAVDENGMISGGLKGFFEAEIASLEDYLKALGKND